MTNTLRDAGLSTLSTFSILPLICFCLIPVYQDRRSTSKGLFFKIAAVFLLMESVMFLVYLITPPYGDCINMLLCVFVFFYFYEKEFNLERSHLWFLFMTACLIGSFTYFIYIVSDILLYPASTIQEPSHPLPLLIQHISGWILVLLFSYPARKHLGWLVHSFHEEPVWKVIWLLPMGFTIFSRAFVPYDNSLMYLGRFLKMYIITIPVLLTLVFLIYVLFYITAHTFVERQDILRKNTYLEIQSRQYQDLLAHVQETSRLRHDFRHHLTVIAEMIKNKNYEETDRYLKQYIPTISHMPLQYCGSSPVNALLNHYASLCQEAKISTKFHVRLQDSSSIQDIDFCVLLGNLLENAMDGCSTVPEDQRRIQLKILQTTGHVIVLQICNPYTGPLFSQEGQLRSTKHQQDGQGLKSVQIIAEKYHGVLEVCHENQIFDVKVLLNF